VTVGTSLRARLARRDWPLAREPVRVRSYLILLDLAALAWGSVALAVQSEAGRRQWAVLGVLLALVVAYEEAARRLGRPRLRIGTDVKRDTGTVWLVAAAVALTPGLIVIVNAALAAYLWLRRRRSTAAPMHRALGTASASLIGSLGAHAVVRATSSAWDGAGRMPAEALSVAVVLVVFPVASRGLAAVVTLLSGGRRGELWGSRDENVDLLAMLCLGGLVALAAAHQPWLCVLVLPPMVTLQRGAFVRALETAASIDAKTGLLNAVAWEESGRRELARSRRTGRPVAVLILDIDRFKRVNDRFGHLAGDDMLRQVGRTLACGVREFDSVGRFGGEEFVVVLPEATVADALVVAERLRERTNEIRMSVVAPSVAGAEDEPMSISVGVACSPGHGGELTQLLMAADRALYAAKARGRNCVVLADPDSDAAFERVANG
jgi:diguanylate cyclase (GGDEF)-like protein